MRHIITLASACATARLSCRSLLLPTKSLFTFSHAYLEETHTKTELHVRSRNSTAYNWNYATSMCVPTVRFLSISFSHCLTLLKESRSVTSYTCMKQIIVIAVIIGLLAVLTKPHQWVHGRFPCIDADTCRNEMPDRIHGAYEMENSNKLPGNEASRNKPPCMLCEVHRHVERSNNEWHTCVTQ